MKVLVINGSPKGRNSITYQTIRFLHSCGRADTCVGTGYVACKRGRAECADDFVRLSGLYVYRAVSASSVSYVDEGKRNQCFRQIYDADNDVQAFL